MVLSKAMRCNGYIDNVEMNESYGIMSNLHMNLLLINRDQSMVSVNYGIVINDSVLNYREIAHNQQQQHQEGRQQRKRCMQSAHSLVD